VNFPKYPYLPFGEPIPAPLSDVGQLCLTIDAKWKPYLVGLLKTLLIDRTWESDELRATGEASLLLEEILLADFCKVEQPGVESEDCMGCCIRWSDGGVLQVFSCGEWTDVPGAGPRALANGSQPAQGAPQPAAGECENFIGKVLFFGRWLVPVPVSTGDQITVNNTLGATTDYIHDFPGWKCGDGTEFIGGGCLSESAGFNAGDPAPAFHHANLIGFDGTNYYDFGESANATPVTITILPGISNVNFSILINSEGPAGAGDLSFDLRVCKQAVTPVGITYSWGSGPGACAEGDVLTLESTGVHDMDYEIRVCFTRPVKLEFISKSGWTPQPLDVNNQAEWDNCASFINPVTTIQTVTHFVDGMSWDSGTPWTLQVKVTAT